MSCDRTTRTVPPFVVFALTMVCLVLAVGCTSQATLPPRPPPHPAPLPDQARAEFGRGISRMVQHDRQGSWEDGACAEVAATFLAVSEAHERARGTALGPALYNAGLANQRCGWHGKAKPLFEAALAAEPTLHRADVQLALQTYRERGAPALDAAIDRIQAAVVRAEFQDVDALVNLASLQMVRDGRHPQAGCEDDISCAKLNIQRALAIDDGYMPAFNQLALQYLSRAKRKAGKLEGRRSMHTTSEGRTEVSAQMLDLAALVCSQAIRRNARYAPIYNTLGLIQVELEDTTGAARSFHTARTLDRNFFEAHMNHAAVNLSFRGFEEAERAYRDALRIAPNDYEARLGLALAVRGQMDASNVDRKFGLVQAELQKAKSLDGSRPEAYFNEAILLQEFEAKFALAVPDKIAAYRRAISVFQVFLEKAGTAPEYGDAIRQAQERISDMIEMIRFFSTSEAGTTPS